jgi:protein subunit release factor B
MSANYQRDRESLERDSELEFFVAGGPGGQHRNKVATGVRLRHRPSGLVVTATERRSQSANREAAYARLAARLEELARPLEARVATQVPPAQRQQRRAEKTRRATLKRLRQSRPGSEQEHDE